MDTRRCTRERRRCSAISRCLAPIGSLRLLLAKLSRIDVLVIHDWAMAPFSEPERRDFWEICEDRYRAPLSYGVQPVFGGFLRRIRQRFRNESSARSMGWIHGLLS